MIKYFTLFFLLLISTVAGANTSDPYKNIDYLVLDNGLKVYMLSDEKAVNTQIELDVKVGMNIESEKNAGISHLLEHLIFRDQRVPHKDYVDYLKGEGATFINGYTSDEVTQYVATIDSQNSFFLLKSSNVLRYNILICNFFVTLNN